MASIESNTFFFLLKQTVMIYSYKDTDIIVTDINYYRQLLATDQLSRYCRLNNHM